MAIEIIPKKAEAKPPTLLNFLFYFSLVLLIIAILDYFSLFIFQKKSEKMLSDVKAKIAEKGTPEEKALEEKTLFYQEKIDNFSNLLNFHQSNFKFFTSLEGLTHPKVFFSKADLKIREGEISLSGIAENFEVLGQQFIVFKKENYIKNINLSKVSIGKKGKVEFTLEIYFQPEKFKY